MTETALQRTLPEEVFGRAYGLALPASIAGIAAGSLIAPVLVSWLGATGALLACGAAVVGYAALLLRGTDSPAPALHGQGAGGVARSHHGPVRDKSGTKGDKVPVESGRPTVTAPGVRAGSSVMSDRQSGKAPDQTGPAGQTGDMTMRRTTFDKLLGWVGVSLGIVLLAVGGLLLWGSSYVHNTVQSQLAEQQITFPPASAFAHPKAGTEITPSMIPSVSQYAGQQLLTGQQAEAYADHFIAVHIADMAGGKTYSQLSAASLAQPNNTRWPARSPPCSRARRCGPCC